MSGRLEPFSPFTVPLPAAMTALLTVAAAFQSASAQWTVTNLHPSGEYYNSYASGTSATQQVGGVDGEEPRIASLWSGTPASWVSLHPSGYYGSEALAISGNQQVGYVQTFNPWHGVIMPRACLWTGTAESFVNLNPGSASSSAAIATSGTQQVGYASIGNQQHAGMWSGTAASWVDLHPAGALASAAQAVSGSLQSGYAVFGTQQHAVVWSGTAGSWVDLSPAGATSSFVRGASGTQQVGAATIGGIMCAGLWHGTPDSWISLNPVGSTESLVYATSGDLQVGYVEFDGEFRASLWSGTAVSWVDLNALAPAGFVNTMATGIWSDGSSTVIVGHGLNPDTGYQALLWTVPAPGAAALLGLSGLFAAGRSRRGVGYSLGGVGKTVAATRWFVDPSTAARARPDRRAWHARHGRGAAIAIVLTLGLVGASNAHAQWTAMNLHPPGARSSGINAVSGTQQGGYAVVDGNDNRIAALWSGSPGSFVNLHPSSYPNSSEFASTVTGISGSVQVGVLESPSFWSVALAWNGSPSSYTVLNPAWAQHAYVFGAFGTQQVGHVSMDEGDWPRACLWNGTAQSYLNLHPASPGIISSTAADTSGGRQAGWVEILPGFVSHASLWSGSQESWVDLHPTGATWSRASAISGSQVGGSVMFGGSRHAGLWNGTVASWVDLHPAGAEHSGLEDMWGTYQVGWTISGGMRRASLWSGDAASWLDLGAFLPAGFTHSQANGIGSDGSVIHVGGEAFNSITGEYEAFLWTVPAPGATGLLTVVGLTASSRRRRPRGGMDAQCGARRSLLTPAAGACIRGRRHAGLS